MPEGCTVGLPFEKLISVTHYITYITTKEKKITSKYAKIKIHLKKFNTIEGKKEKLQQTRNGQELLHSNKGHLLQSYS